MNNILFTKVTFYRNLKDYKFVPKLSEDKRNEIVEKIDATLDKELLKLDRSSLDDKMSDYLSTYQLIAGNNNVMFLSKDNVAINMFAGEHMTIVGSSIGFDKSVFARTKTIIDMLDKKLSMSYNDNYGYLMSDLSRVGAGLKLECGINLHAITALGKINQVKQNVRNLGFNLSSIADDNYLISTVCNLGRKESEIVLDFEGIVEKLQDLEVESAKILAVENRDEIMDRASRSVAILKSAYLLNYNELSSLLSNIRLGCNLGYVDIKKELLDELQKLIKNKNIEYVSKSELISLADTVKKILKGA